MKNRKLLFSSLILAMGISLFSCMKGGNVESFPASFAIIDDYDMSSGGILINTPFGTFIAPSLTDVYPGNCVILDEFTIDYDNQPANSTQYYTITNASVLGTVTQRSMETSDTVDVRDYTLPISNATGVTSVHYNGMFFTMAICKDKSPDFRLIRNTKEPVTEGKINLYLLAQPSVANTSDIQTNYAFDVLSLVRDFGQETTINGIKVKYITINLKYFTGISESTGEPEFGTISTQFEVYIFN